MKHVFTQEEMRPSTKTIYFIKQIAYSYSTIMRNGKYKACYLN